MKKVITSAVVALAAPAVIVGTAYAAPAGQIEGGDIYRVKNITKNVDFTDPAKADKCDTVQYRVRIHNPGPDALTGVRVKATLPTAASTSHSSTVTVSAANANPATTTDTAGVNLSTSAGIKYVAGTTELLDANGAKLQTLPDTITAEGVTFDSVGVSVNQKRFVQFQAKVDCPTPVTPPVTPAPVVKQTPAELPKTGPADTAAIVAGVSILGTLLYRRFLSRQTS
jgi:uncharacterized repeat protein (TIGR01451 family)